MSAVPPSSRTESDALNTLSRAVIGSTEKLSIDELDAAICTLARGMNAFNSTLLRLVRDFDDRLGWAKWSFESCADWLAWRCGIGLSAAREKVRTAHALRDLPAIAAAFDKGRVSYSKVRALTRAADASNEEALLAFALDANAAQVEERCRQIRNARRDSVEEARRAWQRRTLSIFRNGSRGTMTISVEVPLDAGEIVARAIDRAVQVGDVARGPEFGGEGWHAQQADALVAVARAYLSGMTAEDVDDADDDDDAAGADDGAADAEDDSGRESSSDDMPGRDAGAGSASGAERQRGEGSGDSARNGGRRGAALRRHPRVPRAVAADHYQVVVHVDEAALRGSAGRSELPIETVRRLACDGSVTVVTENANGDPLNVGRRQRIVTVGLRRALWSRDRGCTFPGCRHRRYVEAHHVRHWVDGGETSADNTTLLCSHHHRLVHEGGLRVKRSADGELEFRRADGRAIPRCGYRVDDAAPDPIVLDGFEYRCGDGQMQPSAEGWLSALIVGRNPAARVREERASYQCRGG
ncbi:MAG: DUF222 domain-containing protein [Gammaproteobacteria bacterium]|nr:DUF222 domain-containing protein [Gammaproteobacteria bacterium]